jgi:hypothetical protein
MTLENLLNSTKLFFDRKIGGEEYCAIFQEFYEKYFNINNSKNISEDELLQIKQLLVEIN